MKQTNRVILNKEIQEDEIMLSWNDKTFSIVNQCEGGNGELMEGVNISCKPISFRYEMEPKSQFLLYIRMLAAITGWALSYNLCENIDIS